MPTASGYRVYILESPNALDLLTGRQEREPLRHVLRQAGIDATDYLAVTVSTFGVALGFIAEASAKSPNTIPVLHVSAHGGRDGIVLTSGERLTWSQLGAVLTVLNKGVAGRLLLCMSTCEGFNAFRMVTTKDGGDVPFAAMIGPATTVEWRDALVAFVAMYHLLAVKGVGLLDVTTGMNTAAGLPEDTFFMVPSALVQTYNDPVERERLTKAFRWFEENKDAIREALRPRKGTE